MTSDGSNDRVRWGLLGTGSITDKVVPGARRSERVTCPPTRRKHHNIGMS